MTAEKTGSEPTNAAGGQQQPDNSAVSPKHNPHHHEKAIIKALVIVTIVVLIGFLMAYFVTREFKGSSAKKPYVQDYSGFEFTKVTLANGTRWTTEWKRADGQQFVLEFIHPPWDVENITVTGSYDNRFQLAGLFITFDPVEGYSRETSFVALAAADLSSMLQAVFERKVFAACTVNATEGCKASPIITCSTNASVIYLKVSKEAGIFFDGNCATIQGYDEGLTKAADKALYQWLGIMKK